MKTSIKTGFAQIFSCYPQKMGVCENLRLRGGLLGLYAPLNETKKDKLFFKQLRSSYLLG